MEIPNFYVAGVKFHQLKNVISDLSEGDELDLVPKPTNKFDSNAVAIKIGDVMLGYVPKTLSAQVSAKLEIDPDLCCTITSLNPSLEPWKQLEVSIHALDEVESDIEPKDIDEED